MMATIDSNLTERAQSGVEVRCVVQGEMNKCRATAMTMLRVRSLSGCDTWADVSLFTVVVRARCNPHVSVNTAA
jgi:hypothetical protein